MGRSFWSNNKFVAAASTDHASLFERSVLCAKGFVRDIENELLVMLYDGQQSADLVLIDDKVKAFEKPKYGNFNQRYCKRDEVAATEKAHALWAQKKKELEEKQKSCGDDAEAEDDSDDEDFDLEEAKLRQSSGEEEDSENELE